ncbi:AraC family transcriptional regulator [Catenuloplanes sp. NPDC051500]|uniref:AraC family transcriptional regulator n=1 Tax=Catenuloplanes sp. NPDC051500 TaxID=3363959 RepID=UPI0037ADCEB6
MHLSVRTDDLDHARSVVVDSYYKSRLDALGRATAVGASLDLLQSPALTVGALRFGVDMRTVTPELGSYHVNLPVGNGRISWEQPHTGPMVATVQSAAVFRPVGLTTVNRWEAGCMILAVKVDREVMERALRRIIGRPVDGPLLLGPSMDVTSGPGRTWAGLVRLLAAESRNPDGLASHPILGPPLAENVVRALLLSVDHQYADLLREPVVRSASSVSIQRALDAIHDAPERPWTLSDLARTAQVSVRALQMGFRRHCGVTPTAYLRDIRLTRAHLDLSASDPATAGVAEIANRWGFVHLGRFAARYRERYACHPSDTLNGL